MTVLGSDGLSLLVGDGAGSEVFTALKGLSINQFEIVQQSAASTALGSSAWRTSVGVSERSALIDYEAFATDDAAAVRVRSLAISGASGNFRLELTGSETFRFTAYVTNYRETTQAGAVKRFSCRLESSGVPTVV